MAKPAIFGRSLAIVTLFTQRLPVSFIPKQLLITFVGLDVIDYCCRCNFTFTFTLGT
jgi:hypothetical protein